MCDRRVAAVRTCLECRPPKPRAIAVAEFLRSMNDSGPRKPSLITSSHKRSKTSSATTAEWTEMISLSSRSEVVAVEVVAVGRGVVVLDVSTHEGHGRGVGVDAAAVAEAGVGVLLGVVRRAEGRVVGDEAVGQGDLRLKDGQAAAQGEAAVDVAVGAEAAVAARPRCRGYQPGRRSGCRGRRPWRGRRLWGRPRRSARWSPRMRCSDRSPCRRCPGSCPGRPRTPRRRRRSR